MMAVSLLYHDVVDPGLSSSSGFPGPDARIYKFERPEFERHLQAIDSAPHRRVVSLIQPSGKTPAPHSLFLTFDDGGSSAYSCIADLLEKRSWRGHFFVATDYIDQPAFLTRVQLRTLLERGHIVGSHSCSHPARMSRCSWSTLEREWRVSIAVLSDILGRRVWAASVPGVYYSTVVAQVASCAGIEVLFTSEPTARLHLVDGCLVLGRYSIQQGISAEIAAAIACGHWPPPACASTCIGMGRSSSSSWAVPGGSICENPCWLGNPRTLPNFEFKRL